MGKQSLFSSKNLFCGFSIKAMKSSCAKEVFFVTNLWPKNSEFSIFFFSKNLLHMIIQDSISSHRNKVLIRFETSITNVRYPKSRHVYQLTFHLTSIWKWIISTYNSDLISYRTRSGNKPEISIYGRIILKDFNKVGGCRAMSAWIITITFKLSLAFENWILKEIGIWIFNI